MKNSLIILVVLSFFNFTSIFSSFKFDLEKVITKIKEEPSKFSKKKIEEFKDVFSSAKDFLRTNPLDQLKNSLPNPLRTQKSLVKKSPNISLDEMAFRRNRAPRIKAGLEQFLGEALPGFDSEKFTIGFVGTGGGYRAMILTAGYIAALEEIGLLEGIMYLSALSGSTWMVAPWITGGGSARAYKQKLINKFSSNQLDPLKLKYLILTTPENIKSIINNIIWPKFLYGQPIRSIDFYGFLLSQVLLGPDGIKHHLSEQWPLVKSGNVPFPIYSAISISQKDDATYSYDWYEFNPLDVRNLSNDLYIPTVSFGSNFNAGIALETAPEQLLGYLLGIFGSVTAVNFKDLTSIIEEAIQNIDLSGPLGEAQRLAANFAFKTINELGKLSTLRASPAQVLNPFRGYSGASDWLQKKEYLTFVDAGIAFNIPMKPLLRPARKVKLLIVGESSADAITGIELGKFLDDVSKPPYNYNYSRVGNSNDNTIHLYKDINNKNAPRIIYINFLKDPKLMRVAKQDRKLAELIATTQLDNFNPAECLKNKCSTFNFDYTQPDYMPLMGIAEFNVRANAQIIKDFLREALAEK